ncbi:MAG: GGDEF domain-containing protein [Acutalibacteraceae bacterium]
MVAPLIGGVIQIIFQDVPVLSVGIVISFLLAYINIIESLIFLNPLTGISNRKKLLQQLLYRLQNIKPDEKLYFLFIDVDKFKRINDSYGHVEGDRVLTDIALLLTRHTTGTDSCVGRYGGDEFAVIFTLKKTMSDDICARFIECLHDNDITAGGEHKVTLSIGCTECTQSDSIKDIIARADKEMHEIKKHKAVDHCIS